MFHVKQKVVCVNDLGWDAIPAWVEMTPNRPVKGQIYIVREIYLYAGEVGLLLNELINPIAQGFTPWGGPWVREPGFPPGRFRPLIERKTDISLFIALLGPKGRVKANHCE